MLSLSLSLSISLLKGTKNTACTQAKPVKRRTAGKNMMVITVYHVMVILILIAIQSASYSKVLFDIWIAQNVNQILPDDSPLKSDVDTYVQALQDVKGYMEEKSMTQPMVTDTIHE